MDFTSETNAQSSAVHRSRKIRFCSGVCHLLLDALPEVIEDSSAADTKDTKHKSNSEDLARKESEKFFEIVSDAGLAKQIRKRATHRKLFARCWTLFLQLDLPDRVLERVLESLDGVLEAGLLDEPVFIAAFLSRQIERALEPPSTSSSSSGSASASASAAAVHRHRCALLSLSPLFTLMLEHNLEYPDFYKKLYNLLSRPIFRHKERYEFFKTIDTFLSSTLLSENLVAAFAKRLSRLALHAPSDSVECVLRLIYNLLKRHPECQCLVNRAGTSTSTPITTTASTDTPTTYADPYNANEHEPAASGAADSSLWEVADVARAPHASAAARLLASRILLQESYATARAEWPLEKACYPTANHYYKRRILKACKEIDYEKVAFKPSA